MIIAAGPLSFPTLRDRYLHSENPAYQRSSLTYGDQISILYIRPDPYLTCPTSYLPHTYPNLLHTYLTYIVPYSIFTKHISYPTPYLPHTYPTILHTYPTPILSYSTPYLPKTYPNLLYSILTPHLS